MVFLIVMDMAILLGVTLNFSTIESKTGFKCTLHQITCLHVAVYTTLMEDIEKMCHAFVHIPIIDEYHFYMWETDIMHVMETTIAASITTILLTRNPYITIEFPAC